MGKEENVIQRQILDLLKLYGVTAWRNNSGTVRAKGGHVHLATKGTSDIIGFMPWSGRILAIEVKKDGERPTDDQKKFLNGVAVAGGISACVDTLEGLPEFIGRLLILDRNQGRIQSYLTLFRGNNDVK